MALQHFYSRVPFRMSLYNKADGYDTFAVSAGVDRDFIERELFPVCDRKPTPEEARLIRENKLPPVYCAYLSKEGQLIESCTSYIPLDYTGERSAYLVHSLIFSGEEQAHLLNSPDAALLNPALFVTDIGAFDLTDPEAHPLTDYPEKEVEICENPPLAAVADSFDPKVWAHFLFALIDAVCGKTRAVFFSLPAAETDAPHGAAGGVSLSRILDTVHAAFAVLPYHIRERLGFASGIGDPTALSVCKVRYVRPDCDDIPSAKGAYVRFATGVITGVKEEHFAAGKGTVDFLADLMHNDALRREFLRFCDHAVTAAESLGTLNWKTLDDLVFLFRCGSGLFPETEVLPTDDAVLHFFTVYEKSREALSDEFRLHAVRCLKRYPDHHAEIPRKVFQKVAKLYPTDSVSVQHVIMGVALELIHMDIMRSKLFAFIKGCYPKENEETRAAIIDNLCRVFYGGFLQGQILEMLAGEFPSMQDESKDTVVEKLLLSIRTKNIQGDILHFIETDYPYFTAANRARLFAAVPEHLPLGDSLAEALLNLVDVHVEEEPPERISAYTADLERLLTAEQRAKKHPLLEMLAAREGFSADRTAEAVFTKWTGRKIFGEYAACICRRPLGEALHRFGALIGQENRPDAAPTDGSAVDRLVEVIRAYFEEHKKAADLYDWIEGEKIVAGFGDDPRNQSMVRFSVGLMEQVFIPRIKLSLCDAFRHTERPGAVEEVAAYAAEDRVFRNSAQFYVLQAYLNLKQAAVEGSGPAFFSSLDLLLNNRPLRHTIGAYMENDLKASTAAEPFRSLIAAAGGLLRDEAVRMTDIYHAMDERAAEADRSEAEQAGRKPVGDRERQFAVILTFLDFGNQLFNAGNEEVSRLLTGADQDFGRVIGDFIGLYGKNGYLHIKKEIELDRLGSEGYMRYCRQQLDEHRPSGSGFLSKWFKR